MLKKILALNILVVIIINTLFITSSAGNDYDIHSIIGDKTDCITQNGITYILDDFLNYAKIIDINLSDRVISLPEQIEHNKKVYPVKYMSLEEDSLRGFTTIKSKKTCEKLIFPKSLENSGWLKNWSKLKEIYIPKNSDSESIGAIYNCLNLEKLNIGKNVRYAPDIRNCPKLKLSISKDNKWLKLIKNNIYSKNGKVLYKVVTDKTNFIVSNKVFKIDANAFEGCKNLKNVKFLSSHVKIGYRAFSKCTNLKSVILNDVKTIDTRAFYNCKKLSKITINNKKKAPYILKAFQNTKKGIKFVVKNKKVAKDLKRKLKGSGIKKAKILIGKKVVYKNING